MFKNLRHHPTLLFTLPVILENLYNTGAGMVYSYLIGGISGSSLTTINLCNSVITLCNAVATMLITGASILCARLLGENNREEASRTLEQTLLLTLVVSAAITVFCLVFAQPLMSLLMPNAEAAILAEGVTFFRVLILSLPLFLTYSLICGALRSSGDGRTPMLIMITQSSLQLLFAWLFLRVIPVGITGAGLAYLLSRFVGAAVALHAILRSPRYSVRLRNLLVPRPAVFRRILTLGIPTSLESIFVQFGYLIGGSMVIGLGVFEAAVYNVANTLYAFASLPQTIGSAVAMPIIGQLIGAKEYKQAKRTGWRIWMIGMSVSLALSLALALLGRVLTPIYSSDVAVCEKAAKVLWAVFFMCIPAISLNTLDPQLRVGGDVKYVMIVTVIAVWLIRLPLTYLLCYVWNFGAAGVFWANTISLSFRMILNMRRFIQGKYLYMRV